MKATLFGTLLLVTANVCSNVTIDELRAMQESSSERLSEAAAIYVNGVLDGITWTHSLAGESREKPFCIPKAVSIDREEFVELVFSHSERLNVDTSTNEFGLVAVFALQERFPCVN